LPVIRVDMIKGRTPEQKRALVEALTDSFIATCGGKPEQVQIVLADVEPEDWGSGGQLVADRQAGKSSTS
jgi:4-oxalocrotonate tautomerase